MQRIRYIDSHTEGEPTRVVVGGLPSLGGGSVAEQAAVFAKEFDHLRSAVVNEPRGSDFLVGALKVPAKEPGCVCGVIFFNNVGLLNACGHGTLGLAATLVHLGEIGPGEHKVETPVGVAVMRVSESGELSIDNVPAFRKWTGVAVDIEWKGQPKTVTGDVAWGGNWFYLCEDHGLSIELANIEELTELSWRVRRAIEEAGMIGDAKHGGGVIDHIELMGPAGRADADGRNFVLCPGKAYDRSPCGTGTAAKMACLFADGKLREGDEWRQESVIGSRFVGTMRVEGGRLIPTIRGRAFVTAEGELILNENDPFRHGIRADRSAT